MDFVKLKDLDGEQVTIKKVVSFAYKAWDVANKRMLVEDTPTKGFKKRWTLETDRGQLEVSQNQMGKILEACVSGGVSDPTNKTLAIKSDGREIPDYYFNPVKAESFDQTPPFEDL